MIVILSNQSTHRQNGDILKTVWGMLHDFLFVNDVIKLDFQGEWTQNADWQLLIKTYNDWHANWERIIHDLYRMLEIAYQPV